MWLRSKSASALQNIQVRSIHKLRIWMSEGLTQADSEF